MDNVVVVTGSPRKGGNTELLAVCADDREFVFDSVKTMYRDVIRYFSLKDGGIVTACGVKNTGDIKNNPKLAEAEEMGRTI